MPGIELAANLSAAWSTIERADPSGSQEHNSAGVGAYACVCCPHVGQLPAVLPQGFARHGMAGKAGKRGLLEICRA